MSTVQSFSSLWIREWVLDPTPDAECGSSGFVILPPLPWSASHTLCRSGTLLVEVYAASEPGAQRDMIHQKIEFAIELLSSASRNPDNAVLGISEALDALFQAVGTSSHG